MVVEREIYTDKEAAAFLRMSTITLWRERKARKISYRRCGGKLIYTREDLLSYLDRMKQPAA